MELNTRQNQILTYLIESSNPSVFTSSKFIANYVNASIRTIKNDINYINEEISTFGCEIISKAGSGYQFVGNQGLIKDALIKEVKNNSISTLEVPKFRYERVNYIIKKLLSVDYYLTLDDFMDELFVSRSTMTQDMREVREIFSDYNLNIIQKPNYGIYLEGSEISKRLCISEFFFHQQVETGYLATDNAMFVSNTSKDEINTVNQILHEVNSQVSINISDQSFQNFVIHILIAIRRWKFYGFVKLKEDDQIEFDPKSKEYLAASLLVDRLSEYLNLILPDSERYYFFLHFKSKHITELSDLDKHDIERVESVFYDIYHCLHDTYGFIVMDKHAYEQYLRLHIPPMIERLRSGMVLRNLQQFEILTKYPCSTHVTLMISRIIENKFNVKMNQNEFCYLVLYTNLLFDFKHNTKTKLLLVCGRGRPETVALLNELNESVLYNSCDMKVTDVNSLSFEDLRRYDLVISTVPLKDINGNTPIYYLSDRLSYMPEIHSILKSFKNNKYGLEEIFNKAIIQNHINACSRDELFKQVEMELKINDLSTELWKNEHIISHETLRNVVFLHVIDPLPTNLIYVGLLKKPMIWNKRWVQAIIFINLNENLQLLYEVYQYANDVVIPKICNYLVNGITKDFSLTEEI